MHLRRLRTLFSGRRLRHCQRLFEKPLRAWLSLSFARRGAVTVCLKNGRSLSFSRALRDHHLWDWVLNHAEPIPISFTDDGCVEVTWQKQSLLLRPGKLDAFVLREIYLDDVYGLKALPARLGTVIDLGANAGLFSCAVLPRADRVIAVEAMSDNFEHTRRNFVRNGGRVEDVLHLAVTGKSGERIRIYHDARNSGGHSLVQTSDKSSSPFEEVPTVTLARLLKQTGCDGVDLLKCDIEGAEYDVLLNTPAKVLQTIRQISMEVHVSPELPPERLVQLINHLQSAGFSVTTDKPLPTEALGWQVRTLNAIRATASLSNRIAA